MKEKIIETAGKAWKVLGERGEASVSDLSKLLKEREDIINQAIGWLAREDKINCTTKKNATVVSLVSTELDAFNRVFQTTTANSAASRQKRA